MDEQISATTIDTMVPETLTNTVLNRALAVVICLLLGFEILAFGGVPDAAIFVLEGVSGGLLLVWAAAGLLSPARVAISPLYAPMALFALVVAAQLLFFHSAYWFEIWHKAWLWSAYAMLFFLITQCFRSRAWIYGFGIFLAIFGFALALLGIAQELAGNGKFYWVFPNHTGGTVFGPYANHAHFSGAMEMLVPFAIVYATSRYSSVLVRSLYIFAAVIMASSIFMSKSRGGVFGFAVELVVLALLTGRGRRMSRELKLLAIFVAVLVLWLVLVPPSGLLEAFLNADEPGPGGRIAMLKDSLRMLWHRPLLGWGFGNFSVAYPAFRSFYTDLTVNAAHNDFAETAVETGLVGFALMVWWIFRLYTTASWRIKSWRKDCASSTALAALAGCSGLLAHSAMDFNLQVPANAALFFSLAAIATVMPEQEETPSYAPHD